MQSFSLEWWINERKPRAKTVQKMQQKSWIRQTKKSKKKKAFATVALV